MIEKEIDQGWLLEAEIKDFASMDFLHDMIMKSQVQRLIKW